MVESTLFSDEELKFDGFIYRYYQWKQNKLIQLRNQSTSFKQEIDVYQVDSQLQMYNHLIDILNHNPLNQNIEDVSEDVIQKVLANFLNLTNATTTTDKVPSRKRKSEDAYLDEEDEEDVRRNKIELASEIEMIVDMVTKVTEDEIKQLQLQIEKQNGKLIDYKERYSIEILNEQQKFKRLNRLYRKKDKEIKKLRDTTAELKKMLPKQLPKRMRDEFHRKWEEKFQKVEEHVKQHGPESLRTIASVDPQLASWLQRQRTDLKIGNQCLTQDKIEKLNSIGFVWSIWETQFQKLAEYIREHGKVGYKTLHKVDPYLYDWIFRQRLAYQNKQPSMTKDKIDKLNSIGFVWTGPKNIVTYETRLEQCRDFKAKYGHLRVPFLHDRSEDGTEPTEDEKSFRIWAQSACKNYKKHMVDRKKGILNKKQIDDLTLLGFDFQLERIKEGLRDPFDEVFDDRVAQLKRVAELRGNCNDKKNIMSVYPERELMLFVRRIRRHYHALTRGDRSLLTPERMKMLNDIGFDFDPRRHYAPPKTTTYKNFKCYRLENNTYQEANAGGGRHSNNPTSGVDESYDDDDDDDENDERENPYL